ncbi:hypothetical protein EYS09_24800 [Streptomyces kasugaensis]|uniref:DUF2637 domain-containing protein n=1 Tax=Streptomyces kasugaensis TaxID=1946 RepID=A0A4Q9HQM2_STRKA|nr:hypothetical protein [Streptomyces kasugaensis]TBO57025.1 hypothetical protein EYS09_24800 [Streptomyces kasugaensis]
MISDLLNLVPDQPSWLSWAVPLAGAVLAVAVAVTGVWWLRRSTWLSGIGPQAFVALGGVAVSVHGLWGFATQTIGLPEPLAVAFIGVFDAAEMVLLVMLYRTADPEVGWTRELHLMHRTAWVLVAFSGAMNAVHAPNWWARPVLAAIPALAAWLIELQLRSKLHAPDVDDTDARPGPARLVALLWQHAWSALFALWGLDANSSSSAIARSAMAQRAARRLYRFRLVLDAEVPDRERAKRRADRKREGLQGRAQKALDRADIATDRRQALAMARRMVTLTGVEDLARLDYADPRAVQKKIEDLSVTASVERIEVSELAEEAEAARQRAESARREAEDARQRAEAARDRAADELAAARQALEEVESARDAILEDHDGVAGAVEAARQRAEAARKAEQAARQRAEDIITAATTEADRLTTDARTAWEQTQDALSEQRDLLETLTGQCRTSEDLAAGRQSALEEVNRQIEEARLLHDRLRGDLATFGSAAPEAAVSGDGTVFRSEAKQQGWEHYLHTVTTTSGQDEPTAASLAARFGVDVGNARNWLRDFRAARAAQLAARQPRAAAQPALTTA